MMVERDVGIIVEGEWKEKWRDDVGKRDGVMVVNMCKG